jgi:hypothetical protein
MNNVQEVVTDTRQQHIETDIKELFSADDALEHQAAILEVTRLVRAQSQSQRRTYSSGQ